jgi:transcriptional regulator with XRE-family HTH domain
MRPMDLVEILGRNVREARKACGLSQEELAAEAEMKRSYLSDLERGTRNPSVRAVERLARALGVEAFELLRAPVAAARPAKDLA